MNASPAAVVGGLFLAFSAVGTIVFLVNSADSEQAARKAVKNQIATSVEIADRTGNLARGARARVERSGEETKGYIADLTQARGELAAKRLAMNLTAERHRQAKQLEEERIVRLSKEISLTRNELSQTLAVLQSIAKEPGVDNPDSNSGKPGVAPAAVATTKTLQERLGTLENQLSSAELNVTANADVERAAKVLAEQLHKAEEQAREAAARLAELKEKNEEKQLRLKALEEKVRTAQRRLAALLDEVDKRR